LGHVGGIVGQEVNPSGAVILQASPWSAVMISAGEVPIVPRREVGAAGELGEVAHLHCECGGSVLRSSGSVLVEGKAARTGVKDPPGALVGGLEPSPGR
jgi:hypothetical protein